jgi:integrase
MPKRARELSAQEVANLSDEGRHAVGGVVPGLHLRIEGGCKSWVLRKAVHGQRRDLGLGSYPRVSLSAARKQALHIHVNGPPATLPAEKVLATPTAANTATASVAARLTITEPGHSFEWCSQTYIAAQAPGWKSGKHAKQWLATLQRYAFPVIGTLDVATVTTFHVTTILQPIWTTKTETATRVRGRMESILDWAAHKGYRHGINPARWAGNLQHELPSPTKLKKRKQRHHPALPYTRLGAFMIDLALREGASARALEWGILNASRFQEIAGARRREVDLQLKRWTIPPERMKRDIEHVVPLSDESIALFNSLPPGGPDDLLFPAPEGGQLSDSALGAMIDGIHEADLARGGLGYMDPKEGRIATQHGFRSTFRDWASEVGYFDREIVEHAIAHKLKDKAEAAYQRGTLLMKRAFVMEQWGRFCRAPTFSPAMVSHASMHGT